MRALNACICRCYAGYKYLNDIATNLDKHAGGRACIDWRSMGIARSTGDSTLWMGGAGAHTPCHYDTYGFNLHAQLHGRKRWVMFAPDECRLRPTRVPLEESSVFR
jgi:HSPB1-associated protein 1